MNMKTGFRILATLVVAIAGTASRSYASPITVPVGLAPGSQYRLVFVTADTYMATDPNIAHYNTEVSLEANSVTALQALGTTWSVIGSTSSVNVITNIGSDPNVPIYNLGGLMVANDATTNSGGLFSGSIFNPIGYNETGASDMGTQQFTGTNPDGTTALNGYLGNTASNATTAEGGSGSTSGIWIDYTTSPSNSPLGLYAISGVLTVGGSSSTPEPTTTATMIMGVAFLYLAARRRQRIRRAG